MSGMTTAEPHIDEKTGNTSMFDLTGKEFNNLWVNEKTPLFVPNHPLHYKALKLQLMIERLEKQAASNPAQFNSTSYIKTLDDFTNICNEIKEENVKLLGSPDVAEVGEPGPTSEMGAGDASGLHSGVSADNPLAG